MTEHSIQRFARFCRGRTPVAPSRPVYGYRISCSCGWVKQVNGTKREANADFSAHKREAKQSDKR